MKNEELVMSILEVTKSLERIENTLFDLKRDLIYKEIPASYFPKRVIINLHNIPSSGLKYLKTENEYRKELAQFMTDWLNDKKSGLFNKKENEWKREAIEKTIVIEFVKAYQKYLEDSND